MSARSFLPEADPIAQALEIVDELLAEGRKPEALDLLAKVNDALEARVQQIAREQGR